MEDKINHFGLKRTSKTIVYIKQKLNYLLCLYRLYTCSEMVAIGFPEKEVMLSIRFVVLKKAYFQFSSSKVQFIIWFGGPVDNIAQTRIEFWLLRKIVYKDLFSPISPNSDNKFKKFHFVFLKPLTNLNEI
uniref:Uncharacterized protein n=1 Tax=Glossina austeni TaxID=7395 RepID=A0A1A9UMK2_GLOAU